MVSAISVSIFQEVKAFLAFPTHSSAFVSSADTVTFHPKLQRRLENQALHFFTFYNGAGEEKRKLRVGIVLDIQD